MKVSAFLKNQELSPACVMTFVYHLFLFDLVDRQGPYALESSLMTGLLEFQPFT